MSWLDTIRVMNKPRAREIRPLTTEERDLINSLQPWNADVKRLDREIRRLWLLSALTFALSMTFLWWVVFH
jgi:hypothetical protein